MGGGTREREDVDCWLCLCSEKCSNKKREDPFLCYFVLTAFPVVIFGLFSYTERLELLPTSHRSTGFMSLFLHTYDRTDQAPSEASLQATPSKLVFIVLCCFFSTTKQTTSSFLRRQSL